MENHLKIIVMNPYNDWTNTLIYFINIKMTRAKILLIFVSPPPRLIISAMMSLYWSSNCVNVVTAYEKYGEIKLFSFNPFLPENRFLVQLDPTSDIFYNKLKNLHGYTINALYITQDRTKVLTKWSRRGNVYWGRDYQTWTTIFSHINGTLNIVKLWKSLKSDEVNPWVNSNYHSSNRTELKKQILSRNNISVILHSQTFCEDDGVIENAYPHAQDDDCIIVLKGKEIPLYRQIMKLFDHGGWIFYLGMPYGIHYNF